MLDGEEVLRYCLKNNVTIEQFFLLYLLARNDFNLPEKQSQGIQYIHKFGTFKGSLVEDLVNRNFIEDFNSPGQFYPQAFMLTPAAKKQFADYEMAEDLWNHYPVTFPLGDKGKFIARGGGDRDELLLLYLQKINHSTQKHDIVISQLERYVGMVLRGEVNGHKLSDWIRMEMWETIAAIPVIEEGGNFGRDV